MTIRPFLHTPPIQSIRSFGDVHNALHRLYDMLFRTRQGKLECVTEFTLTANAASSVLTDKRLSVQSALVFDPKTANAAAELYGGTMYALTANRGNDTWTITHANNAQTDRTFQVAIIG